MKTAAENLIQGFWDGISGMADWVKEQFDKFITGLIDGIKSLLGIHSPSTVFADIGENMMLGLTTAFDGVVEWFQTTFQNAYNAVTAVFSAIGQWFSARWQDITNALSAVASWFQTMFRNAYNAVITVFSAIGTWFTARWTDIKNAFSSVASFFGDAFKNAWNNITSAFSSVGSFFSGLWNTIVSTFTDIGTKIGNAVSSAFKSAMNSVFSTIENIVNGFVDMINGSIDVINSIPGVAISRLSRVSLPRLAKGGILREGQAIMAEAGPELIRMVNGEAIVTPLTQSAKNTALDETRGTGDYKQTINIYSPKELDAWEVARITRNQSRRLVLAVKGV
jgi:phage-related protein